MEPLLPSQQQQQQQQPRPASSASGRRSVLGGSVSTPVPVQDDPLSSSSVPPGAGTSTRLGAEAHNAHSSNTPIITIPISNTPADTSMPTEFPTQLSSPPLPVSGNSNQSGLLSVASMAQQQQQQHSQNGATTETASSSSASFSAFQAFASPMQAPTSTATPYMVRTSGGDPAGGVSATGGFLDQDLKSPTIAGSMESSMGHPQGHQLQQQQPQQQNRPIQKYLNPLLIDTDDHVIPGRGRAPSLVGSPALPPPMAMLRPEGIPNLTQSQMFHDITMSDPLNDLMVKHIPAEHRVLRDWHSLTEAEKRQGNVPTTDILQELTFNNSWRALARYSRVLILNTAPERVHDLIQLWYVRLLSLVQLGQYEMARAELVHLGDLDGPQYRFENYAPSTYLPEQLPSSIPGRENQSSQQQQQQPQQRRGSMVPFELLVLRARIPSFLGDADETVEQLYELILKCKKNEAVHTVLASRLEHHISRQQQQQQQQQSQQDEESNQELEYHRAQVRYWQFFPPQLHLLVANTLLLTGPLTVATPTPTTAPGAPPQPPQTASAAASMASAATLAALRHVQDLGRQYPQDVYLQSGLGRFYLQIGNLDQASKTFARVQELVQTLSQQPPLAPTPPSGQSSLLEYTVQVHMNQAFLAVARGQWSLAQEQFRNVLNKEPNNMAAMNNLAVCELYSGQLNDSLVRLQDLMYAYPTSAGTSESLVFNLATLFELRTEGSLSKKRMLMTEVAKWAGDQFQVSSLKL